MGEAAEPISAEVVGPVVQFACYVRHLDRHSVAVCPARGEAEKVTQRPGGAEERVQGCFRGSVVRAGRQAK